jgi:hypothetical protein
METNRKVWVIRVLVLGVLVVGLNAKPASAQVFRGEFTLPSEVRWGLATLPAGAYSFTLDKCTVDSRLTIYRGTRYVAWILTNGIGDATSNRSEMVLQGGTVRELSLPQIGLTLYYPAYNPHHLPASEEPQLAQSIPVAAKGAGR